MDTVYIVVAQNLKHGHYDRDICFIYSSRSDAEEQCEHMNKQEKYQNLNVRYEVEDHEVL